MRYVKFIRFGGKNFKNHIDPIEINVENNGLIQISGPNGTGKTSLLEIIPFTFFGRTTKGLTSNDVVNNKIGKNCVTFVEYDIIEENGQSDRYRCTRYANYKSIGNSVVLSKNKEKKFKVGHKEVISEINKLWSKDVFMNTKFFAQKVKDFFMDLQDSDQKQIFKSILRTQDYEVYNSIASEKEKESTTELTNTNNEIYLNKNLIEESSNQIERLKNEKEKFILQQKQNLEKLSNDIKQSGEKLDTLKNKKEDLDGQNLNEHLEKMIEEKTSISSRLENIDSEKSKEIYDLKDKAEYKKSSISSECNQSKNDVYKKFNEESSSLKNVKDNNISEIKKEIDDLKENYNSIKLQINEIEGDIKGKDNLIESKFNESADILENEELENCPTCKEPIKEETRNKLKDELLSIKKDRQDLESLKLSKNNDLENFSKEINEKNNEINNINSKFENEYNRLESDYNTKLNELTNKEQQIKQQIDSLLESKIEEVAKKFESDQINLTNSFNEKDNKIKTIREEINSYNKLSKQIETINLEINNKESNYKELEGREFDDSQIKYYEKKIVELQDKLKLLDENKTSLEERIKILKFWKKGFSNSGIPSMLIDESIPYMNLKIKEYLDKMTYGRYIVSFDTLKQTKSGDFRDKISINVYDNETGSNQRGQFSGGQTRLIDIATILTLSSLQSYIQNLDSNLLIFDEVFDALDDENINLVSKAMTNIAKEKCVVIISHAYVNHLEPDESLTFYK